MHRHPSRLMLKATAKLTAVSSQVSHRRERNQRVDKLMAGLSGGQMRKLLGPLLRRKLRQLRQRKEILAHPALTPADFSSLADFCVANSVLGVLGRDIVLRLLKGASVEAVLASDFLCYQGEPSFSANMQIVFSGTAVVRHRTKDSSIHMPTGVADGRAFRFEFLPVGEQLVSPFLCGCLSALIDATSPYSVLATSPLLFLNVKASAVADELRSCDAKVIERLRATIVTHRLAFFSSRHTASPLILRQGWVTTVLMLLTNPRRTPSITPLQALQSRLVARCYLPGESIATKGKHFEGIIFLWRGEAEFSVAQESGDGETKSRLVPLSVIGERSACLGYKSKHTIVAKTTCDAWVLPMAELEFLKGFVGGFREKVEEVSLSIQQQLLMNKRGREEAVASDASASAAADAQRQPLLWNLITSLRSVPYLQDAHDQLLRELALSAKAVVSLPQTALLTRSRWSGELLVLTKGAATAQLGLTPSTTDLATQVFGRGSVLGAECIVEHRWVVSVCSVSVVETWRISRDTLREKLRRHGLLEAAEVWSRRYIISLYGRLECEPPNYLVHPHACRGQSANQGKRDEAAVGTPLPNLTAEAPKQSQSADADSPSAQNTANIGHGKPYMFHTSSGDISFGLIDTSMAIRLLCGAPTVDHVKFASLFPEVMVMVRDCGESGVRLLDSPPLVQVQSLNDIEPAMSVQFSHPRGDDNDDDRDSHIVTFVPGKARPRSESTMENLAEAHRENEENSRGLYTLVHKRPITFFVAEVAELVGERAPWHVLLLERKCLIPGYLEGSDPLPGTTLVRKRIRPFPTHTKQQEHVAPLPPHPSKRNGQQMYHPVNPHGYACILPKSVENPRRKQQTKSPVPLEIDPDMLKTIIESNQDVVRAFYRTASTQQAPQVESEPVVDFDEIFLAEVNKSARSQSVVYEAALRTANQRLVRGAKGLNAASVRSALQSSPHNSPKEKHLLDLGEETEGMPHRHGSGPSKRSHFLDEYERFLFSAMREPNVDSHGGGQSQQPTKSPRAAPRSPRRAWRPNTCRPFRLACTTSVSDLITANIKNHPTKSTLMLPPTKPSEPKGAAATPPTRK